MMSKRPELDTKNPPGQLVGTDYLKPPRYLSDVIKRIQRDEEPMKLPTPIAGPAKALAGLKQALLELQKEIENSPYLEVTNQWYAKKLNELIERYK